MEKHDFWPVGQFCPGQTLNPALCHQILFVVLLYILLYTNAESWKEIDRPDFFLESKMLSIVYYIMALARGSLTFVHTGVNLK